LVLNSTSTSQSVKVVGAGPTTGVTMVSGEKALIAWDGSDFVKVASSTADGVTTLSFGTTGLTPNSATAGAITVAGTLVAANGGTGQSSYTTGDLLYATGSTALSKLGIGTNGQVLTSTGTAPQWSTLSGVAVTTFSAGTTGFTPSTATSGAVTLAGTLATTNGGTGLTSFTANGVLYASSTSALATGSALTFDGTTLTATRGIAVNSSGTATSGFYNGVAISGYDALGWTGTSTLVLGGYRSLQWTDTAFYVGGSEGARLTGTGLGIGTSSPTSQLTVGSGATANPASTVTFQKSTASEYRLKLTSNSFNSNGEWLGLGFGYSDNYMKAAVIAEAKDGNGRANLHFALQADANSTNASLSDSKMVLTYSGNLGLGVTPSAWWSGSRAIQVGNGASFEGRPGSNIASMGSNYFINTSGVSTYISSAAATQYYQSAGQHIWQTAASGNAGDPISFTQAMTLDASGRLQIGGTTAYDSAMLSITTPSQTFSFIADGGTTSNKSRGGFFHPSVNVFALNVDGASGILAFTQNGTERARITSDGNLLVGTTASTIATITQNSLVARVSNGSLLVHHENGNTGSDFAGFGYDSSTIGTISQNSTTTVGYNTSSDYRLKNTIAPMTGALAKVALLKPVTYKWNADGSDGQGFIAHELAEIVPECVNGEKDAVDEDGNPKYQGIDTSFLVATLTAAIQELKAELDSVKAELATLKGK
jgi:hypothetical protein